MVQTVFAALCDKAPDEYVMEPIRATIVEEESGEPIEGAVVVAFWETIQPMQFLKIEETVTDSKGEFSFSGWGPVKRPKPGCYFEKDPQLVVFKPGFYAKLASNTYYLEPNYPEDPLKTMANPVSSKTRKSRYNGKTIKLKPFKLGGTIEFISPLTGQKETRPLTERDWCITINLIIDKFEDIGGTNSDIHYSAEKLLHAFQNEKEIHRTCFDSIPNLSSLLIYR